ncbi:MAG: FUSC family protein [Bacteroidota bacterium]
MFKKLQKDSFLARFWHAAFKVTPGKPAYLLGFRVSVLLGLPIIIGLYFDMLPQASMLLFASLNVTLVDMGGMTYRKTARILLLTTILNAVTAVAAQWIGLHIISATIVTFFWLAAVAMLGLLGNSGVMVAFVNSVLFVIIVANPSSHGAPIATFLTFIIGGLWAMLLSLFAWPIKPYQPIRKAAAACFNENAIFLRHIVSDYYNTDSHSPHGRKINMDTLHSNFMDKIEKARAMLSDERSGRFNTSEVEDAIISLIRNVSKDHRSIMSLMVWFKKNKKDIELSRLKEIAKFFNALAEIHDEIARLILHKSMSEQKILTKIEKLKNENPIREKKALPNKKSVIYGTVRQILERIKDEVFLAAKQKPTYIPKKVKTAQESLIVEGKISYTKLIWTNISFKSTAFRHALRIGITSAASVFLVHTLKIPHGYWMPLTVVVIMAPDFGGSFLVRTLQRGSGTIFGGLFAVLLISQIHNQYVIIFLLMVFTFIAISMITINYAIFVFFLTPLIVTMYSISDIGDWHIPLDRVVNTLGGMILALVGSQFLFPDWERNHFHDRLSNMLDAINAYFSEVLLILAGEEIKPREIIILNRKMELAASNTTASLQKTLTQPGFNKELITPMMFFMSSSNQLMQSVTRIREYAVLQNSKIKNVDSLVKVGHSMSELITLMSNDILVQKSLTAMSKNKLVNKPNDVSVKIAEINKLMATLTGNSLPVFEFGRLAEIESNMVDTLSTYLLKHVDIV